MFDERTIQHLGSYVYILIDPFSGKQFYVGKWMGQRVFNHVKCALEEETISDKYEKIREITRWGKEVKYIIVRHGLTEDEAYKLEASIIDVFDYFDWSLTNIAWWHNSIEKWLMTVEEIKRIYNAEPLKDLSSNCVIININKQYKRGLWDDGIYQATKETWTIDRNKVNNIKYVLSEYRWLIVEVFEVQEWYTKERWYNPWSKKYWETKLWYWFNWKIADKEIRDKYINKSISHLKTRWSATVIRYNIDYAG